MQEDLSQLKTGQALLEQRQSQTDKVISDLGENLKALKDNITLFEGKITKGFYIACGVALAASGSLGDLMKIVSKFIGG